MAMLSHKLLALIKEFSGNKRKQMPGVFFAKSFLPAWDLKNKDRHPSADVLKRTRKLGCLDLDVWHSK